VLCRAGRPLLCSVVRPEHARVLLCLIRRVRLILVLRLRCVYLLGEQIAAAGARWEANGIVKVLPLGDKVSEGVRASCQRLDLAPEKSHLGVPLSLDSLVWNRLLLSVRPVDRIRLLAARASHCP